MVRGAQLQLPRVVGWSRPRPLRTAAALANIGKKC